MTDDSEDLPSHEDMRRAMDRAIRAGLMRPDGDGTFSITEAGTEWFEALLLSSAYTLH